MGWIILAVLALLALAALWLLVRPGRAGLQLIAAALCFACAGYAWQGHPDLAGAPRHAAEEHGAGESAFSAMRGEMLGRFDTADRWLTMSESYAREGDTKGAADLIRSALRQHPDNATLWIGYGNALVLHGNGLMSPAAEMAYQRAARLAPQHPAPRFFYGLSLAQGGRLDEAERVWRDLLASAPPSAKWREQVQAQIDLIERAKAMAAAQPGLRERTPQ
ncbi:MAG: tetratricopeptide repeat protein [Alphaproteobacteria bacterium]|nr:tetratricopeptide repeat protein [Alphaproteobacteria bacterium]